MIRLKQGEKVEGRGKIQTGKLFLLSLSETFGLFELCDLVALIVQ